MNMWNGLLLLFQVPWQNTMPDVLMFCVPQAVFSSVFYFASVPLYQGFLIIGWVSEWLICSLWNLTGISTMCFSPFWHFRLGICSIRKSQRPSLNQTAEADLYQKIHCDDWNEKRVKVNSLESRPVQQKWWKTLLRVQDRPMKSWKFFILVVVWQIKCDWFWINFGKNKISYWTRM